jgi:hypothetical protein
MHGDALAYAIVGSDAQIAFAILKAEVLRLAAKHRALIDDIAGSERSESLYTGMGANLRALAYIRLILDDRIRADLYVTAKSRSWTD